MNSRRKSVFSIRRPRMPCAHCKLEKRLQKVCNQCGQPTWCSDICCVSQAALHAGCAAETVEVGIRAAGTQLRSLRGRTDFRRTLYQLFTALLDVQPMYESYVAAYEAQTVSLNLLSAALSAYSKAIDRVRDRVADFDKMLDGISSSVAGTLASAKATVKATLLYDVETALRLALGRTPMPSEPAEALPELTFANSFQAMSEFVSADTKALGLATDATGQLLSRRFVLLLAAAGPERVRATRKFKDDLKAWARALDNSFTQLIKAA